MGQGSWRRDRLRLCALAALPWPVIMLGADECSSWEILTQLAQKKMSLSSFVFRQQ
jgi:hypothetical protein